MERSFNADLNEPGLTEKLYGQMNQSLTIQVRDLFHKFGLTDDSKLNIDAKAREGKIIVRTEEIADELREKIRKELEALGARENYKITLE